MANVKDLKKRIRSTKQTFKITKAMKLISASKMARAQEAIANARPYSEELERTVKVLSTLLANYTHMYFKPNESQKVLVLVLSSNKGLCGGYNYQLAKKVIELDKKIGKENSKFYFSGRKVKEIVSKKVNVGKVFETVKSEPNISEIEDMTQEVMMQFMTGEVGEVYIVYNKFVSALQYDPTIRKILPMTLRDEEREKIKTDFPFNFKYDVSPETLLDQIIPDSLRSNVLTSFMDASTSEHAARMSAMDSASKNCSKVIKQLTLVMNKIRQADITTELIEVVSGAEALRGQGV
jgi:F-type H+-transporting ATPase subunit gamma